MSVDDGEFKRIGPLVHGAKVLAGSELMDSMKEHRGVKPVFNLLENILKQPMAQKTLKHLDSGMDFGYGRFQAVAPKQIVEFTERSTDKVIGFTSKLYNDAPGHVEFIAASKKWMAEITDAMRQVAPFVSLEMAHLSGMLADILKGLTNPKQLISRSGDTMQNFRLLVDGVMERWNKIRTAVANEPHVKTLMDKITPGLEVSYQTILASMEKMKNSDIGQTCVNVSVGAYGAVQGAMQRIRPAGLDESADNDDFLDARSDNLSDTSSTDIR